MIVGVPRETYPGERRVALVPATLPLLTREDLEVLVEEGAGSMAGFTDGAYRDRGARTVGERAEVFKSADVVLQVRGFGANPEAGRPDLALLRTGQVLIGLSEPLAALEEAKQVAETGAISFAMELIPRIARAQSMDALTSMATISGYKSVLLAAEALPRIFPMLMTVAGTITPAKVLVMGAGVAGLQAIATARRLGAVVKATDIRPVVKEQIESLGAKFVELPKREAEAEGAGGYAKAMGQEYYLKQREILSETVAESDVVITTAAVPGRKAPVLVSDAMVSKMRAGSIIVDLAAETGGNCELTRPGETTVEHGVTIIGPTNLPSTVPHDASQMYGKNIASFLLHIVEEGALNLDMEDEVVRETLVTNGGEVVHPRIRELLGIPASTGGEERRAS
jgi:NAD(P) transhydrogenase subunit alpha